MLLEGKFNKAKIHTDKIEPMVYEQIMSLLNTKAYEGYEINVMPDCHAGKGCVIGFTAKNINRVSPNLLGVDLSCGVLAVKIGNIEIDLESLDNFIKENIPYGMSVNKEVQEVFMNPQFKKDVLEVCELIGEGKNYQRHLLSVGSLGGGNHYIELNIDKNGEKWIVIHSGSRNFGNKIATYSQKLAIKYCEEQSDLYKKSIKGKIGELKRENRSNEIEELLSVEKNIHDVTKELSFLEGELLNKYLELIKVADEFAKLNRMTMVRKIMDFLGVKEALNSVHTIHNYFEKDLLGNTYIRKGAISAKKDETVIIPINMRDGSIVAKGLGNTESNSSAPHGAGRLMSRTEAKEKLNMENFKKTMQNVYSTTVNENTLDEAPFAYKPIEEIIENTKDMIEIIDIIRPIYNFKA